MRSYADILRGLANELEDNWKGNLFSVCCKLSETLFDLLTAYQALPK